MVPWHALWESVAGGWGSGGRLARGVEQSPHSAAAGIRCPPHTSGSQLACLPAAVRAEHCIASFPSLPPSLTRPPVCLLPCTFTFSCFPLHLQDSPLFNWLVSLYPAWATMSGEDVYVASKLSMAELLLSGCTTSSGAGWWCCWPWAEAVEPSCSCMHACGWLVGGDCGREHHAPTHWQAVATRHAGCAQPCRLRPGQDTAPHVFEGTSERKESPSAAADHLYNYPTDMTLTWPGVLRTALDPRP